MKNIVVIGGATPGKFGNEFVKRTRQLGNLVRVLTWYKTDQADTAWADFSNHEKAVVAFQNLTQDLDHIDLLLYNAHAFDYPDDPSHFVSTRKNIDIDAYVHNLRIQVMIPHAIALAALAKMDNQSSIVFMTTGLALDHARTEYTQFAGYAGAKSWAVHLMLALAHHNDRHANSVAISPFLNYDDPTALSNTVDSIVHCVLNLNESHNGQIIEQYGN